jgi:hypothetical protein
VEHPARREGNPGISTRAIHGLPIGRPNQRGRTIAIQIRRTNVFDFSPPRETPEVRVEPRPHGDIRTLDGTGGLVP